MWKWGSGDDSAITSRAHGTSKAASMSVADLTEQLAETKQLVVQLKELVKEKDNELCNYKQQLKEEKEAFEAKISKLKLQNKAKVASLNSQLEELKKQLSEAGTQEGNLEQKKECRDGDQHNAAASRGKILVLKKKIEELETQNAQKDEELQKKIAELDAAHLRGAEMDGMLAEKQKKLAEKEAFIIDLQLYGGLANDAKEVLIHNSELKNQVSTKEASLQSMEILVQNLTKKIGDSEERCSLLQEQVEKLNILQNKEKEHFQEREAMYTQNIRMFQNIIQEKEKELVEIAQRHEQELFKLAAKSDASADLEQLLKALKQKLHEKEEVMLGRTQVIVMLQQELDGKDQQLKEINETLIRLQSEKDNLQSKLDAEKHVMRIQLKDMMEKHETEMKKVEEKHNADLQAIQEKHETELQEKDQALLQLQKQAAKLSTSGQSNLEQTIDIDSVIKQKLDQLEAEARLKSEEARKSEAKFLKMKAWSKSRIKQLEDELKNVTSKNNDVTALRNQILELERKKEDLQSTLQAFSELKTQNEELLTKLEVYEEQQRKLQADLEQVTKRAASQASESGSVDELQSQLLEWQEIVPECEDVHSQIREEKSAMALRMAQIEEEREGLIEDDWFFPGCSDPAIVSGQQELEEELARGQGIGRMHPERRKSTQLGRKPQEDYGFDGKQCYEDLNITLDSTDSAEGENMGGLRTVVEELELERNHLQEQILFLEERCQGLEDRLQLQGRMEALQVAFGVEEEGQLLRAVQNENDRLQSQLTQLRSQQAREAEKHLVLISNLNEQLKGLNERNALLETLLGEKEQQLLITAEKVEHVEDLRKSLQEKETLNKELTERLLHMEQKLENTLKKCSTYEVECTEQKLVISDLTEKMAALKEKSLKQDAAMEAMQIDLDQTNEELDRLNTSHLDERSQLIQDLQRHEREIDNLKEVLLEKDKEIFALSSSMTEYSEQINILKCQIQYKENEVREMEEARTKAEREAQLLKDVQTADMKDASTKISALSHQFNAIESELSKMKVENVAKTKENEELVRQIQETSKTIKNLHSDIKTRDVTYNSKLMECESQIKLLKEQVSKSSEKLQEAERKYRKETDYLKSQLDEHISAKEKLHTLLEERENTEQIFVNELKSVKDLYNQLILENAKKDEELANLSRQLAEHTEHLEITRRSLQEKSEFIISLQDTIKDLEQQKEKEIFKLAEELDVKEKQCKELNSELHKKHKIINKMKSEIENNTLASKNLQTVLEQKEKDVVDQLKANEVLRNEIHTMEKEKQQLISENESLSKLLDVKECELLKRTQSMAEMDSKMTDCALEFQKRLSEVNCDKETLRNKVEELSGLIKQKENSVAEKLLEKEKDYNVLTDQLLKSREVTKQLEEEIQSYSTQLKCAKDRELEKEVVLSQKESEYNKMVQQLNQEEGRILSLEKHVQDLEMDLKVKCKSLEEKTVLNDALLKQIEEKKVNMTELEKQMERFQGDCRQLSQHVAEKDSALQYQRLELENLHRQIAKKTEECAALNDQLALLGKEIEALTFEKDSVLAICSTKSSECDALQHQLTQHQSEIMSVKHEIHMLKLENEKCKTNIETVNSSLMKKCEETAALNEELSQQAHSVSVLKGQIDTLVTETETLKSSVQNKEALLSQRDAFIQQMKENKDAGESQYLQMISNLQSQVQVLSCEACQLQQAMQGKEGEFKKQGQELKLLKDKSEESVLLRGQLSEHMEIISDLQSQCKTMLEKTEELNKSIIQKDAFLKQKEEECINLQAHISESSCAHQKLVESLTSKIEELKADVSEKELVLNNTSLLNSKLKTELQDIHIEYETLRKQAIDAEELNLNLKKEISDQKKLINDISETLIGKVSLLDNTSLINKLREELYIKEEKIQQISQLHSQMNELTQETQKLKELAQEKENAFLSLQDKFADQYEQKNDLSATLSKKEEFIADLLNSLDQKDISVHLAESNIHALTNEIELLRGELAKNAICLRNLSQEKDESIALSQKKIDSLTADLDSAKSEYQKALEAVDLWKLTVQQRDVALQVIQEKCTEQAKQIECLNSELSILNSKSSQEYHHHTLSIEKLQQQVDSLIKDKTFLQENIEKLSLENKDLVILEKQLQEKCKKLQEFQEKFEDKENKSRMQIDAITSQLKNEKEQLQMQVSVKGEEVGELKFKVKKLEQSLCESENKWVTELDRATQQNAINLEQLSNLEREIKSKDDQIQSVHQEQDLIKKELSELLSVLTSSRYFIKDSDCIADQQITESKSLLQKFSPLIARIFSEESAASALQKTLLDRTMEIHELNNQLKSIQSLKQEKELMQIDFEKAKDAHQSEIEHLLTKLCVTKEALCNQQCLCRERETALTNMKKEIIFLQEKIVNSEKEFENAQEVINTECQRVAKLLEEAEHKNQVIDNLTSQANQQKDLISSLSQQLKEKDCSVTQVMESMSNEMVKFSEEKNVLIAKLQKLEATQNSAIKETDTLSQQLAECKKELELSQFVLADKDAVIKDLMSEKEQLNFTLEKVLQEKENLKKKLQAALIIRKDLMQKIGKLEENGREDIERERKKTKDLLEQIDELMKQRKHAEVQNKGLEAQVEVLKEQLIEKDDKIKDISEMLAAKELLLEQFQKNVTELKDSIAEQKNMSDEYAISLQEKDALVEQLQSALNERERTYRMEYSQLVSTIENLKAELAKKEETFKETNEGEETLNAESSCTDTTHLSEINQVNQLQREKKILQKKLQALLVARKENTTKIQKEKEEHAKLLANFNQQIKDFELLKKEHNALQEIHQMKCKEFDSNLLLLCSLKKEMETEVVLPCSENVEHKTLGSMELNMKDHAVVEKSEKMVAVKEAELAKLHSKYTRLMEENKDFKEELQDKLLKCERNLENTVNLKNTGEHLNQNYEENKNDVPTERGQLQQQQKIHENELMQVKTVTESVNNEKEIFLKKSDQLDSKEEIESLKHEIQQANTRIAEKSEEIQYLHHSLKDLKGEFGHGKEIMKEVFKLQQSLQKSQEEAKYFQMVFEKMRHEREDYISNLEKSNTELLRMKEELIHSSEENKKLLVELNLLHEKLLPASNEGKNVEAWVESRRQNNMEAVCLHSGNQMQDRVQEKDSCKSRDVTQELTEKHRNGDDHQPQEQKYSAEEKNIEHLQRKLQAALMSRKEALKENKILKDEVDLLMTQNKELVNKVHALENTVSDLSREKQDMTATSSLYKENETVVTENARLLVENENLSAACESLKSTMETIVQEKEAFSFQMNSLKDSQTVELTGWKAKHSELKQEYESLLQAYENISSKIAEMRQVIDITRKEKQDALHQASEAKSEKQQLEKLLQKATAENAHVSDQLKQLVESKQRRIDELQTESERWASDHKLCLEAYQEKAVENKELINENEQLKEMSEVLKQTLEKTQNENETLCKDFNLTKAALKNFQTLLELDKLDVQCEFSDTPGVRESLLKHIHLLIEGISEKEKSVLILKQENKLISKRLKDLEELLCQKEISLSKLENDDKRLNQDIVSLNERIKILEDDKCLLQEELENVQETSYKVKNEREFLETELLNHIKKLDETTDQLKAMQVQNSLVVQQLEDLRVENSTVIREKEEQHLYLVKVFEGKVKSAQRDNNGTKNKTKELQELLKEKQQEINQLQKDSVKYQEMILDLEKSVKLQQSRSEKLEKDLNNTAEKLAKSNEEIQKLTEKVSSQKILLEESRAEVELLATENMHNKKELKKKVSQILNQKKEYDRQLEIGLQQLKATCQKEYLNIEEKYSALQQENKRIHDEHHKLQEEFGMKDSQNKNLQAKLNDALAKLAAFAKCMSSLQNDQDRVIGEVKSWETQFKEAIENKQQQIEASNKTIALLQEAIKAKIIQVQELECKCSVLEEPKSGMQASVESHHFSELSRMKEENAILQNIQCELETALQSKENSLQALIKEKKSLNHLIRNNDVIEKEMEALQKKLTQKEQEVQQFLLEKSELQAELQNQVSICDQMKAMLNKKDTEISFLISSKDTEISGYLAEIQTQNRQQVAECEQQLKVLQIAKKQSDEICQKLQNDLKVVQMKADKAVQHRAEMVSEIDAFKKSMSSLQYNRDSLLSKLKDLEREHQIVLSEKESFVADSVNESQALKQEIRKLLNQIDDLHSENAMLLAQLTKYREDLNQVLSLKDHQLKELLAQKLEIIRSLEQEKTELQKKQKEMKLTVEVQEEIIESLRLENEKLTAKIHDLEIIIASINKKRLASESREEFLPQEGYKFHQKRGHIISEQLEEIHEKQLQVFQQVPDKNTVNSEDRCYTTVSSSKHDACSLENESAEKRILEVQSQNKELKSQIESFGKAMTALQSDRDLLIEDFKVLQSRYTSEIRSEKNRADRLESELKGIKSSVFSLLKENTLLSQASEEAKNITLEQFIEEIKNLCKTLNTQHIDVNRLSSECENYSQQIDAFSKAMASLQDDRDGLLQELNKLRIVTEAKQGMSSIPSLYINEISSHKDNLETLQMDREILAKEGASPATAEISDLKSKVYDLERDLNQTKVFQEESVKERISYQSELIGLRREKNLLLTESRALQNKFRATIAEKDRQIAELQRVHCEMVSQGSGSSGSVQSTKVMQLVEENAVLSAQLKMVSQALQDNQLCYTDLQNRYLQLEREYQTQISAQGTSEGEAQAEVPPGAPQEKAAVLVEIDNVELSDLRKRLAEMELQHDSMQQTMSQLMETLSEERKRRQAAEEHLELSESQLKRLEIGSFRSLPREYAIQMESDEERDALIINTSEHIVVRKVKGGALSFQRWIRGRSFYCSKLLTSRAKSRYLFLSYLVILHLLVFLCLTGVL
ncbi:golgin subfamily B member 1-like isoform X3 [Heteronotia binoei]|uniref:golgin subfamily B member 1-like isoform X3 n=1 Tax=Heteronotia binoei TaxID=13085 RepID=UPI00292D9B51|nr:golgin subfamily B member 1-like isoform X3 [Heteronotia binoei]